MFSNGLILLLFVVFIIGGMVRRVNVYESFIEGAKQGFQVAVTIIPYLVAMLVAISVLRSCGVLDFITRGIGSFFHLLGVNTDFVPALPTALMRPLSGAAGQGYDDINHDAIRTGFFCGETRLCISGNCRFHFLYCGLIFRIYRDQ